MGKEYGKGAYLELLEFCDYVRAQRMHAALGVPGELNALALVCCRGGMSIAIVSSQSRVDRSGVFRGALTAEVGEEWELPNVSSQYSVRNCVNGCVNGHGASRDHRGLR
jgi:hypothetical protein